MRYLFVCLAGFLVLAAARPGGQSSLPILVHKDVGDLPEAFDAREKWPHCPIGTIYDVGSCHATAAYSVASTIMDRYCIHKNQYLNISAQDLLTCCGERCNDIPPRPCAGSVWNDRMWEYWNTTGIVTGGAYNSGSGCRPYQIKPCDHFEEGHLPKCPTGYVGPVQTCVKQCEAGYPTNYSDDKQFGHEVYAVKAIPDQIKKEILTNGPIQTVIVVDNSFFHYKTGVYHFPQQAGVTGLFGVKIIGWGHDPTKGDYWICNNFWNAEWGDKGTFKLSFEDTVYFDTPYAGFP